MAGNQNYFLNFPIFNYNGYAATNILARSVIASTFIDNTELFYEYTVLDGQTADAVAYDSYGNSSLVWILYLFNPLIDPYYGWPLSQTEFSNMIDTKYGGYSNANRQIQYYQNNWEGDDTVLNLSGYNALPSYLRKYWSPVIMSGNHVYQYKRAQQDTIISTNQILTIPVDLGIGNTYISNEYVTQNNASGFVAYSNSSVLTLQHIKGAFTNTNIITGAASNVSTISTGVINQNFVIPNDEAVYFSAVTVLDVETENNATKSQIKIVKEDYLQTIIQAFSDSMNS